MSEQKPRCVVCKTRHPSYGRKKKLCHPCAALVTAENTWKNFGLTKPQPKKIVDVHGFVTRYNECIDSGMTMAQAAETLGLNYFTVKNRVAALAKQGHPVRRVGSAGPMKKPEPPIDTSKMTAKVNEHGGGKCGVAKCNCGPCLDRRRQYRRDWTAAKKLKGRNTPL